MVELVFIFYLYYFIIKFYRPFIGEIDGRKTIFTKIIPY